MLVLVAVGRGVGGLDFIGNVWWRLFCPLATDRLRLCVCVCVKNACLLLGFVLVSLQVPLLSVLVVGGYLPIFLLVANRSYACEVVCRHALPAVLHPPPGGGRASVTVTTSLLLWLLEADQESCSEVLAERWGALRSRVSALAGEVQYVELFRVLFCLALYGAARGCCLCFCVYERVWRASIRGRKYSFSDLTFLFTNMRGNFLCGGPEV